MAQSSALSQRYLYAAAPSVNAEAERRNPNSWPPTGAGSAGLEVTVAIELRVGRAGEAEVGSEVLREEVASPGGEGEVAHAGQLPAVGHLRRGRGRLDPPRPRLRGQRPWS